MLTYTHDHVNPLSTKRADIASMQATSNVTTTTSMRDPGPE